MWLAKRSNRGGAPPGASYGVVTIGGRASAAVTDTELRDIGACLPGGYCWRPKAGQSVLILKDGEKNYIIGAVENDGDGLESGEIIIRSDAVSIELRNDGKIKITGDTSLKGDIEIEGSLKINGNEIC
jgi:hypothetical protein